MSDEPLEEQVSEPPAPPTVDIEARKRKQALHDEIKTFIGSKVHTIYVRNTERDVTVVEERILDDEITNLSDLFTLLDLRGQRKVLRSQTTLFEDAVARLDSEIQESLELEQQTLQGNNDNENQE